MTAFAGRGLRRALHGLMAVACVSPVFVGSAVASLPDGRGYELVSPVAKNGLAPYAAVPSANGEAVDFQARGAFAGATWGSLNLYQANRTAGGWHTTPLTPTPSTPLGALEQQAPVWYSQDLSETIFTTPQSYAPGDKDSGALDLYSETAGGGLAWLSQGSQGDGEPSEVTFDGATSDGSHVLFSAGASLVPAATGLTAEAFPEPEYLYERDVANGATNLLSLDSAGHPAGFVETTLPNGYTPGSFSIEVARAEGFFPGQIITVGVGEAAETAQITKISNLDETSERLVVNNNHGLHQSYPPGTPVRHLAEGAVLGDGTQLAAGPPPANEFLPANAGGGSTTNAVSSDGSKVFFEAPSPEIGQPVGLYMRESGAATVKIAGAGPVGATIGGIFKEEEELFGSARYEGAAGDGSLVFFTSNEGLASATKGTELYEFNTTGQKIGPAQPMSVSPVSAGLEGDQMPTTTLTAVAGSNTTTITVASTTGFSPGEAIAFAPFESSGILDANDTSVVSAVLSATELSLSVPLPSVRASGVPAGTVVHGVHSASLTAVSNTGSRVYFVSDGVLALNANAMGAKAVAVKPNLYVFDTGSGETTFIGTLMGSDVSTEGHPSGLAGEPDISRPAVPTPDGRMLAFASAANLTGQNPGQEFTEIYRYSVAGNSLVCISCTGLGVKPTGDATFGETAGGTYDPPGLSSPISEDGNQVFFDTPDSLVTEDENGAAPVSAKFGIPTSTDVYEWEGGVVSLLSSGASATPSVLRGVTPSGGDVLFTTTAVLKPQVTDGGYENVWDARTGGGFPAEADGGAPSCEGTGCRAAFGTAPVFAASASTIPQGAGNVPSVTSVRPKTRVRGAACRRGFVRKRIKGGRSVCAKRARGAGGGKSGKGARRAALHVDRSR